MKVRVFDDTPCALGEGPLWHPERRQFFWFDILARRLLTRDSGGLRIWPFPDYVSAAGWVDRDTLLIASATALTRFNLETEQSEIVCPLEAEMPGNRSNDGRADPQGGFWIGTMGRGAETGAGAIYRFYRGELRKLFGDISIPNAICFAADGGHTHFTDTVTQKVMRVTLDPDTGWPDAEPTVWLDLSDGALKPDGAVVDADGHVWIALYGAGKVNCYDTKAQLVRGIDFPAAQTTCPAFGGDGLGTLYCTSATQTLPEATLAANPHHGKTFAVEPGIAGRPEPRVIL